jgi:hypothetical protein
VTQKPPRHNKQQLQKTDIQDPGGIRTRNPSRREVALDREVIGIKDLQTLIVIKLGGTQSWYGHFKDPKNLLAPKDIIIRFLHFAV